MNVYPNINFHTLNGILATNVYLDISRPVIEFLLFLFQDNIDYQLLDNFSSCMKAAFGQQPQHMMKRNSELVNSLLGLPQNVLRAGK